MSTLGLPSDECLLEYDDHRLLASIATSAAAIAAGGGGGGAEEWFTPEQFGAKGNGTTDDTVAVQDAADAASAVGGVVLFGSKTYKVTSTITVAASAVRFVGLSWGTKILASGDYGDIFLFDKGVVPSVLSDGIVGGGVYMMYIDSDVARTTGAAIHTNYTHAFEISSVRLGVESPGTTTADVHLYEAISMENQSACLIEGCHISSIHSGAHITGNPITSGPFYIPFFGYDGKITACDFWGKPNTADSIGLFIDAGCGGFRLEGNSNISHYGTGTKISGAREVFICQSYNDGNLGDGIYVESAELIHFDEAWAAGNGGYGLKKEGSGDFQLTGGRYATNGHSSIFLNSINRDNVHIITGTSTDGIEIGSGDVDNPGLSYSISGGWLTGGGTITDAVPNQGTKLVNGIMGYQNVPSSYYQNLSVGANATGISNFRMGQAVLSGGTVVVTDANVTASTKIFISVNTLGTIAIAAAYDATTRTPGVSFTIKSSSGTDTSTVDYIMIEP